MKLQDIFEKLADRMDYVSVGIKRLAKEKKLLNKNVTPEILDQIGIKDKATRLKYLSADIWTLSGLGFDKGVELYKKGITLAKLKKTGSKEFAELPIATQMYLIHKPMDKIPNKKIKPIIKEFFTLNSSTYKEGTDYDIVGSYRRKLPFSTDIDILWYEFNNTFPTNSLDWNIYAHGKDKISGIYTSKAGDTVKIDVWLVHNKHNKAPMMLYTTGSKMFNIRQRSNAKKLGYLLNQDGIYKDKKLIPVKTEKDIFKITGMVYKEPHQRH